MILDDPGPLTAYRDARPIHISGYDRQEIDFYYKLPGKEWRRTEESAEISGMDHNVLGGFLDVRPALCAYGGGKATFRAFKYWSEVKAPV